MFEYLFSAVDGTLSVLPIVIRLVVYGTIIGAGSMLLYWRASDQESIREIQEKAVEARKEMHRYEGSDPKEVWARAKTSLALSSQQVARVFLPTRLAAIPILAMMGWLEGAYSHRLPAPGETIQATIHLADESLDVSSDLRWTPNTAISSSDPPTHYQVIWPDRQQVLLMEAGMDEALVELPLEHSRPYIQKRSWWDWLWANPVGYLPEESRVEAVGFSLPPREFLSFGPPWLRTWHSIFLLTLSVAALLVKFVFRIK